MRKLIIVGAMSAVIVLSGCAAMSPQDQTIKTGPGSVRVSGDINVGTINRNGF